MSTQESSLAEHANKVTDAYLNSRDGKKCVDMFLEGGATLTDDEKLLKIDRFLLANSCGVDGYNEGTDEFKMQVESTLVAFACGHLNISVEQFREYQEDNDDSDDEIEFVY